jgi:hypothetical protein
MPKIVIEIDQERWNDVDNEADNMTGGACCAVDVLTAAIEEKFGIHSVIDIHGSKQE